MQPRLCALWLSLMAALVRPPAVWAAEPKVLKAANVVLGPSEVDAAPRVEARIEEVTVFSDRARVRRRGRVALKGGATLVRLPDLPGAAFLDTIHVAAAGARVLRVETTPVQHERMEIAAVVKLLDALDAANDRAVELADEVALDRWEINLLTQLAPAPEVPEEKREGRKGVALDVPSWWKALDFVGERIRRAQARVAVVDADRRKLDGQRDQLRAEIAKMDQGGFSERAVEVVAVLDAAGAETAAVELEYFVPAARWKPSYDLHFSTARGQVRLETAAVVEQATGEDWDQAAVSFSTATPGRGIDLPELLTWTLGEKNEFVPSPRARVSPPEEPLYPLPPPEPIADQARAVDTETVRQRIELAKSSNDASSLARGDALERDQTRLRRQVAEDMKLAGLDEGKRGGKSRDKELDDLISSAETRSSARYQPERPADENPLAGEEMASVRQVAAKRSVSRGMKNSKRPARNVETDSDEQKATPAPAPSSVGRADSAPPPPPVTRVPLALYDRPPPSEAPTLSDPYLPAVSAGGFDFVYRAPTPVTIPSTDKQIRIPLASQTFSATAFYEAMPALAATAFLRARVRNDGKRPILRGPAAIFGDGELVGVGEIQTTGPSGEIELPLGADQDIRLVRQVVPSTKTTGVVFKTEETTYDVQIQIGNYKKQPVTIEVTDQIPRSRNDKVQVKLLAADPKPLGEVDIDGTIRFRVDVPAGATRTVKLRYQIVRPQDWELYQR